MTLDEYLMDRDKLYPKEFTGVIKMNAERTVAKVSLLLKAFGEERAVSSGWRPAGLNALVKGASKNSWHIQALACDLVDADGRLGKFCLDNVELLRDLRLYIESPSATKGWLHVQLVAPRSGRIVFMP